MYIFVPTRQVLIMWIDSRVSDDSEDEECNSDYEDNREEEEDGPVDYTLRHRNVKGFTVDSDDEEEEDQSQLTPFDDGPTNHNNTNSDNNALQPPPYSPPLPATSIEHPPTNFIGWVAASLLPQYTEKIVVPDDMHWAERFLASFTCYRELRDANVESDYGAVYARLQMEWTYTGGLVSLALRERLLCPCFMTDSMLLLFL